MILQIIGWFCLLVGGINFMALFSDIKNQEARREVIRNSALFLIAAAICFK